MCHIVVFAMHQCLHPNEKTNTPGDSLGKNAFICIFNVPNMTTIKNIKANLSCWIFIIMSACWNEIEVEKYLTGPVIYQKWFDWNAVFWLVDSYLSYDKLKYLTKTNV